MRTLYKRGKFSDIWGPYRFGYPIHYVIKPPHWIIPLHFELLDGFYYGQYDDYKPNYTLYPTSGAEIAVSPDGDVYFLVGSKEKYTFYKVERQWWLPKPTTSDQETGNTTSEPVQLLLKALEHFGFKTNIE